MYEHNYEDDYEDNYDDNEYDQFDYWEKTIIILKKKQFHNYPVTIINSCFCNRLIVLLLVFLSAFTRLAVHAAHLVHVVYDGFHGNWFTQTWEGHESDLDGI